MAFALGGRIVPASRGILLHLPKNPRVSGGGAAYHHGVAAGFADHALGVFRGVDVAVTDDGDLHCLFHRSNDAPVGSAGVTLQSRARMHRDAFDTNTFRHFGDFDGDDGVFVPSSAELDGERDFDGSANRFENLPEERKIAQQAGAAALDYFLCRAAEIDVHGVIAQVFDHAGGFGHDFRIRAEKLRGDGMLVFLKIKIAKRFGSTARDAFGAGELRHKQAAAAEAANDAPEKRVRNARHRRKYRGRADGQIANSEKSREHEFSIDGGATARVRRSRRGRWS